MMVPTLARACVTKEFAAFATNKDRPVSHYLRALARDLKSKTGSKGVGVIGQCFFRRVRAGGRRRRQRAGLGAQPAVGADRVDAEAQARPPECPRASCR